MTRNLYSWFLGNVLLPIGDTVLRQGMVKRLRFLQEAQWWDAGRIEQYRQRQLRMLLRTAYEEVPFYRDLFDSHRLHWRDITTPAGLRQFPVVTKDMMRAAYPDRVRRKTGLPQYVAHSSGSTGENFLTWEDSETAGQYRAAFLLALEWSGWYLGARHVQLGAHPERGAIRRLKDFFLRCHYVFTDNLSNSNLDNILSRIERDTIYYLLGYPSSIHMLALRGVHNGWQYNFPSIITWGEMLHPDQRATMEQIFHSKVYDTYGCSEGIQISAQCGYGSHYHVLSFDTIVEYVDHRGSPVPPGIPGNVLLTRLHPGPMPFIRYEVGDIATCSVNQKCPCGRQMELMESIQGRDTDIVLTPSGNRLVDHFFTGAFSAMPEIHAFQIVQPNRESIVVQIVAHDCDNAFIRRIHESLLPGAAGLNIDIQPVDEIRPICGKHRFIVNKLPREVILSCMPNN